MAQEDGLKFPQVLNFSFLEKVSNVWLDPSQNQGPYVLLIKQIGGVDAGITPYHAR